MLHPSASINHTTHEDELVRARVVVVLDKLDVNERRERFAIRLCRNPRNARVVELRISSDLSSLRHAILARATVQKFLTFLSLGRTLFRNARCSFVVVF